MTTEQEGTDTDPAADGAQPGAGSGLQVDRVSKSFGRTRAVDEVSLQVAAGEFVAIIGPSGSGKTTVMRMIGGFEQPDSGTISIAGVDVTELPAERRDVSTVFQSYALFPHLNVRDNVAFGPRMRGVRRAERHRIAAELLELVRLTGVADRRPHELSGGMQQRVALARALANGPGVLLFDEPLGALDRKLRDEMQAELRRIQQQTGATFVYITHDQDEAFGMADRLVVMRDGRFVQIGGPAEIYDRPADAWVATFVGAANRITGTVTDDGVLTDLGLLRVGRVVDVAAGDRAVVIIRPENTRIDPQSEEPDAPGHRSRRDGSPVNAIAATVRDVVVAGSGLQIRAETPGGVLFTARRPRGSGDTGPHLQSGQDAVVSFAPSAAAAYACDDAASPE